MDEDSNPENSNSSAKRYKMTIDENDTSMSNIKDKRAKSSTSLNIMPNSVVDETTEETKSADNDIELNEDISKVEPPHKINFDNGKDEKNNSTSTSEPLKENQKNEENDQKPLQQNEETEGATENSENNDAGTSNQTNRSERTSSSESGTRRLGAIKRRNYRSRLVYSSSDSDDSDDSRRSITPPFIPTRRRLLDASVSSSSESDIPTVSARHDSESDSTTTTYPGIDEMDFQDSTSNSSDKDLLWNGPQEAVFPNKKPDYNWCSLREVMYREHGLSSSGRYSMIGRNPYSFQSRFYSSRHTIEKMKLLHKLEKHQGCVNSLNFNKSGTMLVTGSDDLKIILWNWSTKKIVYSFKSGHNSNVFQTKFADFSSGLNIVSSGRDGQVRHATIPPSGAKVMSTVLLKHDGAVHKISLTPQNPFELLTAGEDGHVVRIDLREAPVERLVTVRMKKCKVPLYSVAHHPFEPEFCVCGRNQYVHVYDKRNTKTPVKLLYPKHLEDVKKMYASHITCALYNNSGSEILASYSEDNIYLFDNKFYTPGSFLHSYEGHNNRKTIKGVNFFGQNSEYVISGSDCGNFFFWDKKTESIINWIRGDKTGVINCLEPHPSFPVLATSGLDPDVKIWVPLKDQYPPPMLGLAKCVKHNTKRPVQRETDLFDDRTLFFFVHQCIRNRRAAQNNDNCPYVQDLVSSSSSDDEMPVEDDENFRTLPCSPQ